MHAFQPLFVRARTLVVVLALGSSMTSPALGQKVPEKSVAQKVNEAIDLGMDYLIKEQELDGSWRFGGSGYPNGQTALCLYTLLKCGIAKDHPTVARAMLYLQDHDDRRTYTLGCYLMALSALDPEAHLELMEELSAQLLEAQGQGFSYPGMHEDMSLTQYAALGLRAAAKAGIKIDQKAWRRLMEFTLKHQEDAYRGPAGFSYRVGTAITGSMTTAGIACLVLAREQLTSQGQFRATDKRKVDAALEKATQWLAENANFENNPNPGGKSGTHRRHYWLYGIERAGSLLETEVFGKIHWYDELVAAVLPQQNKGGAWGSAYGEKQPNTCFTLLALRRATAASTGKRNRSQETYKTKGKKAPVTLRGSGDVPLNLWIDGFGPKVIESHEWPEDKGHGPRIAKVEYLAGGQLIGTVEGNLLSPNDGAKLAMQHTFSEPGTFKIRARVWLVHPGETVADKTPFESPEMEVVIDEIMTPWMRKYATDGSRNLLRGVGRELASSSQHGGWPRGNAFDGLVGTGWLCATEDQERWIRIVLEKPLQASELALCPANQAVSEVRKLGLPLKIEVSINKRRPVGYEVNPNPFRKTYIDLGKKHRIRQLEIRILESSGKGRLGSLVGFGEIELRLKPQ